MVSSGSSALESVIVAGELGWRRRKIELEIASRYEFVLAFASDVSEMVARTSSSPRGNAPELLDVERRSLGLGLPIKSSLPSSIQLLSFSRHACHRSLRLATILGRGVSFEPR